MRRLALCAALCATLAGCSAVSSLVGLTSGGPDVAANVQAGKTNTQTIGQTNNQEFKVVRPTARKISQEDAFASVEAEAVQSITINDIKSALAGVVIGWILAKVGSFINSFRRRYVG